MSEKRFKLITPLGTRLGLTDIFIKDTQKDYYYNTKEMVVDLLNRLSEENEQLKIANVKWLDKSLQDKKIRYSNANHKELTKKYLQLKEENEQLRKELYECEKDYLIETSDEVDRALYVDDEIRELKQKYGVEDE